MDYFYTYRLTCTHPDSPEKYYYGFRKSSDPRNDINYLSSSLFVKRAVKKFGKQFFRKKILKIFETKIEAMEHEMFLHNRLNVAFHPKFFNRYNQSRCGFNGSYLKGKTYEEILGEERAKELREKRRKDAKNKNNSGSNNPMFGKRHSEEMKKKLSEERTGSKHPTFGWFWITDGKISKKVPPGTKIPIGFKKGRKFNWQPPKAA